MEYKKILLCVLVLSVALLAGCTGESIVCKTPYIRVGSSCCLDRNDNGLCDTDETTTTSSTTTTMSTSTTTTMPTTTSSTTTTSTTTTSSTTTTNPSKCGQKYCVQIYTTGECGRYSTIIQECIDSKTIRDCDTGEKHKCGNGSSCITDEYGSHCTLT